MRRYSLFFPPSPFSSPAVQRLSSDVTNHFPPPFPIPLFLTLPQSVMTEWEGGEMESPIFSPPPPHPPPLSFLCFVRRKKGAGFFPFPFPPLSPLVLMRGRSLLPPPFFFFPPSCTGGCPPFRWSIFPSLPPLHFKLWSFRNPSSPRRFKEDESSFSPFFGSSRSMPRNYRNGQGRTGVSFLPSFFCILTLKEMEYFPPPLFFLLLLFPNFR